MATKKQNTKFSNLPLSTSGPLECALTGTVLLNHPYFNKGSAFSRQEREEFNLTGLLPSSIQTLDQQAKRAYEQYSSRQNDLAKNTFMTSMKEQNEVLYYRLLQDHMDEMFSIIYTPTEGDAIQDFSRLFRKPDGCFLNIHDMHRVHHDLAQWGKPEDIDYIVVTDGEEILGIGDQGCGGVLISTAKLALTTLCAGIHPNRVLPVVLDCGTDNEELLQDELYLGLREKRVRGEQYDKFVDTFVSAARDLFPHAYIHFEDFGLDNARRILDQYRSKMACFNDDVQGTGCVTLAGIMAGLHVSSQKLRDMRLVIFGAGSAGCGIADQVRDAIATEANISKADAAKQIWLLDKPGLLTTASSNLTQAQRAYARSDWENDNNTEPNLHAVIKQIHPNVLIGTSTKPGAFTEPIIREMAAHVDRPIIMPLSNPTRLHEAVPADLLHWTDGRALVATGSPFSPVQGPWGKDDQNKNITVEIAECNNSVVFPGIGLGCVLSRAARLTDAMLVAAVEAVAAQSPALKDPTAPLLPGVNVVRDVSVAVARGVIRAAEKEGLARVEADAGGIPQDDDDLEVWIREQMWDPVYRPLKFVDKAVASRQAKGELRVVGSLGKDNN